ncbi:sensor histidine kinase [Streptomyces flavofungini]|uniref:histidine kinase n=1 Tax=Streptomyces flavofungini TaxID=68200 RepID=A0ABS0XFG4_9ACTN|nr:ATP-binding protein [Streptomyces flavofungini]MBJ3810335.1 sensor histidine kinase KdpD [Streptomyces flavofungini]MBJ3811959.1 sensor histidine kinase KdpD [Streptomyces flavofungini]GHC51021.1 sensor histidine kinase [Streptomyces flavofungini]
MTDVRPGQLKIYLGAAPGVGKTCRMLDEGRRRAARGADVVVGLVECHRRPHTESLLREARAAGLDVVERARVSCRGGAFTELDLDALLARAPQVALVDDLAHTNVPGDGRNPKRWQDIDRLLTAGIDVVTTVNIQHMESLKDVVEKITKVPQAETVPDDVVRRAHQIELVDVAPESLRRRMAHGNIHAPEKVDAALANYFRTGNLTALRQLALLWVADRVDEALQAYRSEHGIGGVWETRERVVVGLTGGPEGDTLIRRAARIADRSVGGELLAVHIARSDGLAAGTSHASLTRQRRLVEDLGGSYHSVVGDDIATALVEFARAENATQLVLGSSRRGRVERFLTGRGTGESVVESSGDIDVHTVTHERAGAGTLLPSRRRTLSGPRRVGGPVAGLLLPIALTFLLDPDTAREHLNLTSETLLFLLAVVGVACIGGVLSAVVASVTASLLLNYWFMPPVGHFTLGDPNSMLALVVFAIVAATVAAVVDRSLRLSRRSARATAEAETMSALAGTIVRGGQPIPALLERAREAFGVDAAELVAEPPDVSEAADAQVTAVPAGADAYLVLRGRPLPAADRRVLAAFAAHVGAAVERARLAEAAAEVEPVKAADRMRTALLRAVGHDLRTPLAAALAAIGSLRSRDLDFSAQDREELLATADESMTKLNRLVDNLLDMSRLQAGALKLELRDTTLEEVLPPALDSLPVYCPVETGSLEEIPAVLADPPLLERVIANLVGNAARHTPSGGKVLVTASALAGRVELRVVDRGPGLPAADRDRVFEPFQRLGDTDNTTGLGLGLALSRGLAEAMDGTLTPEDTPGGGLTMVLSLPFAERVRETNGARGPGVWHSERL